MTTENNNTADVPATRAGEAVKQMAQKICEESGAGILACEEMLAVLKREHGSFVRDITRAADVFAERVNDYLTRSRACAQSMAEHRESMLNLGQLIANEPIVIGRATEETDQP